MKCWLIAKWQSFVWGIKVRPHKRDLRPGDHDRDHCMRCGKVLDNTAWLA